MKNKKIKKIIVSTITSLMSFNMIVSAVKAEPLYYENNGGFILSEEELRSDSLVNPLRNYHYRSHGVYHGNKSVVSVTNIDNLFDYVVMEPLVNGLTKPDLSHVKYIVIHETGTYSEGSLATNIFSYFTQVGDNAQLIVDENTIIKAMDLNEIAYAVGNTDPAKSDVFDSNSISIEMCVNIDGDYHKTVANTVYLVRDLVGYCPNFQGFRQHADAWSEGRNEFYSESFQKNCPTILRAESTWWTWEKFLYFAENKDLPIPFIDFDPTVESEVPDNLKEYLGYKTESSTYKESDDNIKVESTAKVEETAKVDAKVETTAKVEETTKVDANLIKADATSGASQYHTENSIFINSNLSDSEILEFDRYIESDIDKIFNNIKCSSRDIKLTDDELKELIRSVILNCKLEKVNPLIVIELMNSYTGYFTYGGNVTKEDHNYGGLKNKKGQYIKYTSTNEGVIAFVQYIKTLTTNSKLKLKSESKDALKTIKKGSVKEFNDLSEALGVQEVFIESVAKRVLAY